MNPNSNTFTYIFAAVMVILVSVVLTGTQLILKPSQDQNVRLEKMQNILKSVDIIVERESAEKAFQASIKKEIVLDGDGRVKEGIKAFDIDLAKELKKKPTERNFPLFISEKDGKNLSIIPVRGSGLWGPIWGYIAIESDGNTVYGAIFDHKGETPGLGAEIAHKSFSSKFKGKKLFEGKNFKSVKVLKGNTGGTNSHVVDALTGATITCDGVSNMIDETFKNYTSYFLKEASKN